MEPAAALGRLLGISGIEKMGYDRSDDSSDFAGLHPPEQPVQITLFHRGNAARVAFLGQTHLIKSVEDTMWRLLLPYQASSLGLHYHNSSCSR